MNQPFIMVAPNGARRGKQDHSALPIQIYETVNTARACYQAGAHALHLHVRDEQGIHSIDAGLYQEALTELQIQVPELAVQITTEAAGIFDVTAQLACLETLKPTWASISVREMARDMALAPQVYHLCAAHNIKVQHILYDTVDAAQYLEWKNQQVIQAQQNEVLFVLGRYNQGMTSTPEDLTRFRDALPDIAHWMVCAFGPDEHACLAAAARQGGGVRVGFENSLTNADGTPHVDNAASVAALINTIKRLNS